MASKSVIAIPAGYEYLALAKEVTTALDELYVPLLDSEAALRMLRESVYMSEPGHPQWNMCLVGPSGTGKSFIIKQLRAELTEQFRSDDPDQIPVLVVETPVDPTLERMADRVLEACKDPFSGKGSYKEKMPRAYDALARRKVRIIFFDEFQNLFDGKTARQYRLANQWLKGLDNRKSWPIALTGLENVKDFVASSSELQRRFLRHKNLKPYSLGCELEIAQLDLVLRHISPLIKQARTARLDSDHMLQRIWLASWGILDYLFRMAKSAVMAAFREDLRGEVSRSHWSTAFVELVGEMTISGPVANPFDLGVAEVQKLVVKRLEMMAAKVGHNGAKP